MTLHYIFSVQIIDYFKELIKHVIFTPIVYFIFRVNCYDAVAPQTPFGGFKQSGQGREL